MSKRRASRGFWRFFGIGFGINAILITLIVIGAGIWKSFQVTHPGGPTFGVWHSIVISPLVGVVFALGLTLFSICVAAAGAKLLCQITGGFPLYSIVLLLPFCTMAGLLQMALFIPDALNDLPTKGGAVMRVAAMSLPMLVTFWIVARRSEDGNVRPSDQASDDPFEDEFHRF